VFKVVDNGIGVPEIQKDKLFTKFMRADNAKKERPDGTGIGLYLVKRVIEDQGGQIIFKSLEGEGSTFGFSLPLGSVPQTALVEAPTSDSQPKPLQPALEYQDLEPEPIAKPTSAAVEPKKVIRKKYYTIQ
jgi:hypothetical protein